MKLQLAGMFREFSGGDESAGSIADVVGALDEALVSRVVGYLEHGNLYVGTPGLSDDVLDSEHKRVASPHIMTDGVWAWRNELPYYVRKYHVAAPTAFVEHMRANERRCPVLRRDELLQLEL